MGDKWEIGDKAYLKEPVKGYRYVEVIGFEDVKNVVETTSGMVICVYDDELEEM